MTCRLEFSFSLDRNLDLDTVCVSMNWEEIYRYAEPVIEESRSADLVYGIIFSVPIILFYAFGLYSYFHQKISFVNLAFLTLPALIWPILCFSPYISARKDPSVISGKLMRKWKSSNHGALMFEINVRSVRVLKNSGKETEEEISNSRIDLRAESVFEEIQESEEVMLVLNGKSEIIFCIKNGKIL